MAYEEGPPMPFNEFTSSFGIIPIENIRFLGERIYEVLGHLLQDLGWEGGSVYNEKLKIHPRLIDWNSPENDKNFYFCQAGAILGFFLTEKVRNKAVTNEESARTEDEVVERIKVGLLTSKVESIDAFPLEGVKRWVKLGVDFLSERIHEGFVHILREQKWKHGSSYNESSKIHPDCTNWESLSDKNFYIDKTTDFLVFLITYK